MLILCISVPHSQGHGCDFILLSSGPFQKTGRERGCIHTGIWKKPSELVQNRSKIRVVQISLTTNFLPFGDSQWMLLIVLRFSAGIFAFLAELKSYKYYFLNVWRNHNFLGQSSLNSINKLLVFKFQVLNLYPKLLIFHLLVNFWFFWTNQCLMSFRG